jgi:hypothetical protein
MLLSFVIVGGVLSSQAYCQTLSEAEVQKRTKAYVDELNKENIKTLEDFARLVVSQDPPRLGIEARVLQIPNPGGIIVPFPAPKKP